MQSPILQRNGALAALLLMCLLLGVALATGVDALTTEDDIADAPWFALGATVLALTAAIALCERITRPQQKENA